MRTDAPVPEYPAPPSSPASPQRIRLIDRITTYRQPIGLVFTLLLFGLAPVACRHLLREIDPGALHGVIVDMPRPALFGALGATALGSVTLLGCEWSTSRFAGVTLPVHSLTTGGFSAFAVGNAVGLSLLSGGSVRYRLHSRHDIDAAEIARMTLFANFSLDCALPVLAALVALCDLDDAASVLHLPHALVAVVVIAVLSLAVGLVVFLARHRLPGEWSSPDSLLIRLGRRSLRLPDPRLPLLQLLITTPDVATAVTALYLLLPEASPFVAFPLVYLLALTTGVSSHVPGGVEMFEAVLLVALVDQLGAVSLTTALLLYRLIYVVLPLLLACLSLLFLETRRLQMTHQAVHVASGFAAPILAILVFLSGVVLLLSGATPAIDTRLEHLGFLIPHRLVDASHLIASPTGVLRLLLAQGLRRRSSVAWALTLVLLLVGALLSLLKGFNWEEASLLSLTAALFIMFRRSFYRPSRLMEVPFSPLYVGASIRVVGASVWLLLFVNQDVHYGNQLWWQFVLGADTPRALHTALGSCLLFPALVPGWPLCAVPLAIREPDTGGLQYAARVICHSDWPGGGLVLIGDKALLFHKDGDAFLIHARRGRSMITLYDSVGPATRRAELVWQLCDLCDLHHARPTFYQVRAENLPFYISIGLTTLKLGEETRADLLRFDLGNKGREAKDLHYTWDRGQRGGLILEFHEPGQVLLDELKAVSDIWLGDKQVHEKGFPLGRFTPACLSLFRIIIVRHQSKPVAFVNLLKTGSRELASLDLTRVHPDASKLTMEFLMLGFILHYKARGHARLNLGVVPLTGLQPRRSAPLTRRLSVLISQRDEQFYNFQGLRRSKDKFQSNWESRYLAVSAGLDPLAVPADTTVLIAGDLTGLMKR